MGIAFDCVGTDEWHVVDDDLPQSQSKTSLILDPANDKAVATCRSATASCAPVGIRTPNLLIRSQMLYPLSYGRLSHP